MTGAKQVIFSGFLVIFCLYNVRTEAQLQVGYYEYSCSMAESIVKDEVWKAFNQDNGLAAGLVRMHFHDCFVRGCDGSVLIDTVNPSSPAEKDAAPNNPSLRGFDVIDKAKTRLEAVCKRTVSCADILAFAARDSVEITRGIGYDVPAGRKDGRVSLASEALANLAPPTFNLNQLTQAFANKGLTQQDMVTLSGAHTIGRSRCSSFSNRLYNFNSTTNQDPTLDPNYANQLKAACPQGSTDPNLVVPMDPPSPATFDVSYYRGVLSNRGLFTSDQALLTNQQTLSQVIQNSQDLFGWQRNFDDAIVKMGKIGVVTGNDSDHEIRVNCRVINS